VATEAAYSDPTPGCPRAPVAERRDGRGIAGHVESPRSVFTLWPPPPRPGPVLPSAGSSAQRAAGGLGVVHLLASGGTDGGGGLVGGRLDGKLAIRSASRTPIRRSR